MSAVIARQCTSKSQLAGTLPAYGRRWATTSISRRPIQQSIQDGLSYHWDTTAPTISELRRATQLFQAAPPKLLFSSTTFRDVHSSAIPEVAFFGRSNVGKSSLLNALLGAKICHTSSKPGRTRSLNFFAVGGSDDRGSEGRLAVCDMPGYGKGSHAEWGLEIEKYLQGRKQSVAEKSLALRMSNDHFSE